LNKAERLKIFSEQLSPFLPEQTVDYVASYIIDKVVHFTVSKNRKTKLGDYMQPHKGKTHRISVNGGLNKYAFLITTLHELAHLTTFEKHGNRVMPHGIEWKNEFKRIALPVLSDNILPNDVKLALTNYLRNAKASSCSDDALYRVLRRYDKRPKVLVEHLDLGTKFKLNGKIFVKGKRLRKRYECQELSSRKMYRVLGLAEIEKIINDE
jgi:predicted SprT family Zn-dependent metalloprotease